MAIKNLPKKCYIPRYDRSAGAFGIGSSTALDGLQYIAPPPPPMFSIP
jgi:hypothetical protein